MKLSRDIIFELNGEGFLSSSPLKVCDYDQSALYQFVQNSIPHGDNVNVNLAYPSVDTYIEEFINKALPYMNYVSKLPICRIIHDTGDISTIHMQTYIEDDSIDKVVETLKSQMDNKISFFYRFEKVVNLHTMKSHFKLRYHLVEDMKYVRNQKLTQLGV